MYGSNCGTSIVTAPYIINCDYPSGFVMLQHIYGDITYADDNAMIPENVRKLLNFSLHVLHSHWSGDTFHGMGCQKSSC